VHLDAVGERPRARNIFFCGHIPVCHWNRRATFDRHSVRKFPGSRFRTMETSLSPLGMMTKARLLSSWGFGSLLLLLWGRKFSSTSQCLPVNSWTPRGLPSRPFAPPLFFCLENRGGGPFVQLPLSSMLPDPFLYRNLRHLTAGCCGFLLHAETRAFDATFGPPLSSRIYL